MATDINNSRRITACSLSLLACLLTTTHVFDAATHAFQRGYTTTRSRSTTDHTRQLLSRVPTYSPQKLGRVHNNLVQHAIIYGEDGDYQSEDEFEASSLASTAGDPDVKQLVADRIYTEFPPSFLTNIACAQAPPPHNHLMPQDVLSAELISVDLHQVQIAVSTLASAGGAGDGRCVQLLIPIQFEPLESSPPPPSQPSLMAEYIVQEFQRLERASLESIAKKEWEEDNADQLAAQEKIIFELQDEASLTDELLPDWWTFCELNKGLEEESDTLKNLLNEDDFVTDLNVLFQRNYHKSPIQVMKTCVTAIGPSGVYLRSYAERQEETDEKYFVAELSIPFPQKAPSRDELRSSILTMIETAGEQLVVPAEQALVGDEEAAEEVPLEEITTTTTITKVVVDKSYVFQEQLLRARIQVDQLAIQRRRAQKEEALHRSLLEARLSIQTKKSGIPTPNEISIPSEPKPRKSPLSQSTEAELADKYASIEDVGERAFAILRDLGMI